MPPPRTRPTRLLSQIITLLTSFLFFYGGQAHLTDQFTPDLARDIETMSKGNAGAWWWFGLDAEPLRKYFGIYALITAALLIIPQTSKKAMRLAFGFTILSLYSAWINGWGMIPQAVVAGAEAVALLTS